MSFCILSRFAPFFFGTACSPRRRSGGWKLSPGFAKPSQQVKVLQHDKLTPSAHRVLPTTVCVCGVEAVSYTSTLRDVNKYFAHRNAQQSFFYPGFFSFLSFHVSFPYCVQLLIPVSLSCLLLLAGSMSFLCFR